MFTSRIEKFLHELFELGIFVKGFNGVWETITGSVVLFLTSTQISGISYKVFGSELLEDPNDRLINLLSSNLQHISSDARVFAAMYILLHGILNIFLAIQLYRDKVWAYVVSIIAVSLFMVYQVHRIIVHHSVVLMVITVFDVFFIWLTWHEYKFAKIKADIRKS